MSTLKMNYNDDFYSPERCAKLEIFAETIITLAETKDINSAIIINLGEELGIIVTKNENNSRHARKK